MSDLGYSIDSIFDSGSPYYSGAISLSTPPSAQNGFIDGISPATLTAGEIQGNTTVTDGYLRSENYVAGTSGWYLSPTSGEINFNLSVQQITIGTSGYVRGGQTDYNTGVGFFLGYSGAAYKFSLGDPSGSYITWDGSSLTINGSSRITKNFTAGEALTAGDAVYVATAGDGTSTSISQSNTAISKLMDSTTSSGINTYAQTFAAAANAYQITTVTLALKQSGGSPSGVIAVSLAPTSGGADTGLPFIGTQDTHLDASQLTGSFVDYTFTINAPVIPGIVYSLRLFCNSGNFNSISIAAGNGFFAGGSIYKKDGFGVWAADTAGDDLRFVINEARTLAGNVHRTSALVSGTATPFLGFAHATTASGGTVPVTISGAANALSGLTIGSFYYLSDTTGGVSLSAGTVSRKIGVAVSTTEMLITNIW